MKPIHLLIGASILCSSILYAETFTLTRYDELIHFHKNAQKSLIEHVKIGGGYISYGDLDYLLELDISHTHVDFKQNYINDFTQDDYTVLYSRYFPSFMYKFGLHVINTDDIDLGDGKVLIGEIGKYTFHNKDKLAYGANLYWSHYSKGYDKDGILGNIDLYQISPYLSYTKIIDKGIKNNIKITIPYINTNAYSQKNYYSISAEDTYSYKNFSTKIKAYTGEKRTSIEDDGRTVYNTKDLMKHGYGVELSYALNYNFSLNFSYDMHFFEIPSLYTLDLHKQEHDISVSNSVGIASLTYRY